MRLLTNYTEVQSDQVYTIVYKILFIMMLFHPANEFYISFVEITALIYIASVVPLSNHLFSFWHSHFCWLCRRAVCEIQGTCPRFQAMTRVGNRTPDLLISGPQPYHLGLRIQQRIIAVIVLRNYAVVATAYRERLISRYLINIAEPRKVESANSYYSHIVHVHKL